MYKKSRTRKEAHAIIVPLSNAALHYFGAIYVAKVSSARIAAAFKFQAREEEQIVETLSWMPTAFGML